MAAKDNKKRGEFAVFQPGSTFRGILKFSRPLRILGNFEGELSGDEILEIGPQAKIQANIEANHLVVYGHITGNVVAKEKVELKSGATLIGNIRAPKLEIDDGVIFEGKSEMKPEAVPA